MIEPPVRRGGHADPRDERLVVRVTKATLAEIDRLAAKDQRTRADMVRILLQRGMERP